VSSAESRRASQSYALERGKPTQVLEITRSGLAVVVGCDLGRADSLGFLSFLKDSYPQIRRVALPGDSQPTQLERAIASGAVEAVLVEPFDSDSLSKVLRASRSSSG
jgi:DNA-binding NarL/FixJ family response regulator